MQRVPGADPFYLPDPSCTPVANGADEAAAAFAAPDAFVIKVIYAYAADAPNAFGEVYPALAQSVRDIMEYVYEMSGDRKSMRFDLGTVSGSDCVDVQTIALPHPASYYDPGNITASHVKLWADINPLLGPQPGQRNYLIFPDGVPNEFRNAHTSSPAGGFPSDDTAAGPAWQHGGYSSVVYDNPFTSITEAFGRIGAHELFHALGAVQASAPHYFGGGHCSERIDLMCDGSSGAPVTCEPPDSLTIGWSVLPALDCGGDDYFNPEPAAGSYLATHWNTYNAPFLCDTGTCAPDNFGPDATVNGRHRSKDPTPAFRLSASEQVASFTCQVDARPPVACGGRFVARHLRPARHKLTVTAADAAGNPGAPTVFRFRILAR